MLLDPTYEATKIEPSDSLEAKQVAILSRVVTARLIFAETICGQDMIKKLMGRDVYARLTLDSVAYSMTETDPQALSDYIKKELQERDFDKELRFEDKGESD